ncbi:uncharacterized protein LOC108597577 [Drosophila busckii]|uniref:uncharacterized protein LOC108597577 n=1 Tax=Drosophila busckii TaxID=30019 RepID=UPI00083ECB35|nr:uncharacterized protein LOC108597577 [Drosophila busckii]
MKHLSLILIFTILSCLACVYAIGDQSLTFKGVCQLPGDMCTVLCQQQGGRDGRCNKMQLCMCNPL